jgi:succinate dehydrogenase/fumarate reductase flavoprotein subunit
VNERKVALCIIAGSAAGMSAAIVAKRNGIKDVLILEKMSKTGGTALMTAGIIPYDSPTQKRQSLYYHVSLQCKCNRWKIFKFTIFDNQIIFIAAIKPWLTAS